MVTLLASSPSAQEVPVEALLHPNTDSWPTYHGDYSGRHHSRLTEIAPANVKQLTLAWAFQTNLTQSIKATPIVVNGMHSAAVRIRASGSSAFATGTSERNRACRAIDHRFCPPAAPTHSYELALPAAPPLYRGYVGYQQSGRLFSAAVTVTDMPGATLFSTQSNNKPVWS